jgi:hypothetical protein
VIGCEITKSTPIFSFVVLGLHSVKAHLDWGLIQTRVLPDDHVIAVTQRLDYVTHMLLEDGIPPGWRAQQETAAHMAVNLQKGLRPVATPFCQDLIAHQAGVPPRNLVAIIAGTDGQKEFTGSIGVR